MAVTPEMAQRWLDHHAPSKRGKAAERTAQKYAEVMREGRWISVAKFIVFDQDGALLDGARTLRAVAISGITVEMFIITSWPRGDWKVLDRGCVFPRSKDSEEEQ